MGKRKSKHTYEYITKKLKKWEKKLQRETRSTSHSREDTPSPRCRYYDEDSIEEVVKLEPEYHDEPSISAGNPISSISALEPVPTTSTADPIPPTSTLQLQVPSSETEVIVPGDTPPSIELDSKILEILGEDPSVEKIYGKEIQTDLAVRLQHLATKGLSSEHRKELIEKYLPPSNCKLIDSPELNLEIKAAISEVVLKRDKGIEIKQKQLGCAISCLSNAITLMIAKEDKDTELIQMMMDTVRLLCDNQHSDSTLRRNFILHNLKKEMKEQLQKTIIDKNLFGSDLAETLKIAKTITKTGAELKSTIVRPPINRIKPTAPPPHQLTSQQQRNNLNWRAPPPSRRQMGTQRTREPAQRTPLASTSRGSYRGRQQTTPATRASYRSRR